MAATPTPSALIKRCLRAIERDLECIEAMQSGGGPLAPEERDALKSYMGAIVAHQREENERLRRFDPTKLTDKMIDEMLSVEGDRTDD